MKAVIPHYGMNRVAVSEFALAEGNRMRNARPDFQATPMQMAKDMEGRLISKLTTDRCVVLPNDKFQQIIDDKKIEPENILSEQSKLALGGIMVEGKPLSSVIVGFFKKPSSLSFTCGLVDVATMKPLLVTSSIVDTNQVNINGTPSALSDSDFPIKIQVKNKKGVYEERKIQLINDRAYVPLQKGEVYQIVLWNRTNNTVGFRVLVDGMNTHPERETKIVPGQELPMEFSTMKSRSGDYVSQKLIPLQEANFWVLKPTPERPDGTQPLGAEIQGFYQSIGPTSTYREFVVTEAAKSKAALAGYTNELGIITVGVYSLRPRVPTRGPGNGVDSAELDRIATGEGEERTTAQEIKIIGGKEIDETKSLVHIRYLTPENFQLLLKANQN